MLTLGLLLALVLGSLPEHAQSAWQQRHLLLLGIDPRLTPLPAALAEAGCPPLRREERPLPVDRYLAADLERNRRLYGEDDVMLNPRYVVLHFTVVDDAEAVLAMFSRPSTLGVGNQEPVTSLVTVHYMVNQDGVVWSLVPEERRTSGTYGLDHRALAIEMVARDEQDLLSRPQQLLTTFCLVDGLLRKYDLPIWAVLSHQEVALGKVFLSDYTDRADTEYPYWYPKPHFRYDPGPTVMAWFREFLLRRRGWWEHHPAAQQTRGLPEASGSPSPPAAGQEATPPRGNAAAQ